MMGDKQLNSAIFAKELNLFEIIGKQNYTRVLLNVQSTLYKCYTVYKC